MSSFTPRPVSFFDRDEKNTTTNTLLSSAKARRKDEKKNKQQGKKEKEKERIKARGISLRRSKEVLCREIDVFHFHTQYVYIL